MSKLITNTIRHTGATVDALTFDANGNTLIADSEQVQFGTGSDLKIYYDGSNSYFDQTDNTGNLNFRTNSKILFKNADSSETIAKFIADGSSELYYDNSKKVATASDKVNFYAHVKANADNTYDIGASGARWATIYSQNALNTSDRNLKNTIQTSDLGLSFVNKLNPVSYKFNQIQGQKQDTKTHYGLIAQEVEEVLTTENKTTDDFAAVISAEGTYNLAYNELISPLIKAVQELSIEVETLKAKVAELEAV